MPQHVKREQHAEQTETGEHPEHNETLRFDLPGRPRRNTASRRRPSSVKPALR